MARAVAVFLFVVITICYGDTNALSETGAFFPFGPASLLSPVQGGIGVVASDAGCSTLYSQGKWCFIQHKTGYHRISGGINGSDDTYAWDVNLNAPIRDMDDGKPVYSVADGVVARNYAGVTNAGGSAGQVLIEHDAASWWSGYLHLENIQVVPGQNVTKDTILGYISNIGPTDNNHLHFVIYDGANTRGSLVSFNAAFADRFTVLDVKANGSDGPLNINNGENISVKVKLLPGQRLNEDADMWAVAATPFGLYYFSPLAGTWMPGLNPSYSGPLFDIANEIEILKTSVLPSGDYTFYFGVDMNKNYQLSSESLYFDSVDVKITNSVSDDGFTNFFEDFKVAVNNSDFQQIKNMMADEFLLGLDPDPYPKNFAYSYIASPNLWNHMKIALSKMATKEYIYPCKYNDECYSNIYLGSDYSETYLYKKINGQWKWYGLIGD